METPRDRRTGRYKHEWAVIGEPDQDGHRQVEECQLCEKVRVDGISRSFANREAVRNRPDVQLLTGY